MTSKFYSKYESKSLPHQLVTTWIDITFENIVKQENAGTQHLLLSPLCFLPLTDKIYVCVTNGLPSASAFSLVQAEILLHGKVLKPSHLIDQVTFTLANEMASL